MNRYNCLLMFIILICAKVVNCNRIMFISSYDENYDYAIRQFEGVKEGLKKGGIDISKAVFKTFYMDTIISYPRLSQQTLNANYLLNLINIWKPDVAIVTGSNAFSTVAIRYRNMIINQTITHENIYPVPFLFCGVFQDLTNTGIYPNLLTNSSFVGPISGIAIPEPFQNKINVSLSLNPNAKEISFVFDDTPSSRYQYTYLLKLINSSLVNTFGLPIGIYNCDTFPRFKSVMLDLQNNGSAIIVVYAIKLFENNFRNTSTLPHLISDWVKANVGLTVVGPVEQNFSIDVRNSPNATCSYAGYLAANVLLSNNRDNVTDPVLTDPDEIYVEYNANQESFVALQGLKLPFSDLLNDPKFISNLDIYQPIIFRDPIKLFIVHSYSESFPLPVFQGIGFLEALAKQGLSRNNYYLKTFWMDTKDTYNTVDLIDYISNITLSNAISYVPQMLFGTNDNALDNVLVPYVNLTKNTIWNCTCVFAGVYEDPSVYDVVGNLSSPNLITGVLERFDINSLINFSLQINNGIKKITVISDNTKDGNILKKQIDSVILQYQFSWPDTTSIQFQYFSELKKYILSEPLDEVRSNLILFSSYGFKQDDGSFVLGQDVIQWVNANRNGTEVSQYSYFVVDGGLLSLGQNPVSSGQSAGYYASVIIKNQRNISSLPVIENVSSILSINRQRANLTNSKIPNQIMIRASVYESDPLISTNQFSNSPSDTGICYSIFVFYLILAVISIILFLILVLFYNKKGRVKSSHSRKMFYIFVIALCAMRMIHMILELNVTPPAINLISVFVLYKLGTILYIGLMMLECMMWIYIFQSSFTSEIFISSLKIYCYFLFVVNALAQIVSIVVFSIFASDAVSQNETKILAYNQGLYVSRYGSIRDEIVQTNDKLRLASQASQLITGIIGVLHSVIFFLVGIVFLHALMRSTKNTDNKTKKRKYTAMKVILLTIIICLCSTASLIFYIIASSNSHFSTKLYVTYIFELIIFEIVPTFSLLITYIYSTKKSFTSKKSHVQLKEFDDPSSSNSSKNSNTNTHTAKN
eukprot:TRINITY_DN3226_c0_g1_i1.p1 TRINITY_DN3226_c0_g1~~TRINITY_DN3226_c0_g1_i1.p1  ORF type:complete len:1039 (-),score=143.07 TRINITY_DN3226_c0_g1_i1:54-3170(-)